MQCLFKLGQYDCCALCKISAVFICSKGYVNKILWEFDISWIVFFFYHTHHVSIIRHTGCIVCWTDHKLFLESENFAFCLICFRSQCVYLSFLVIPFLVFQITFFPMCVFRWGPDLYVSQCLTGKISCVFRSPWAYNGCMWVGTRCLSISVSHWFHLCVSDHHEHAVGVCGWGPDVCVSQCLTGSISLFPSLIPSLCFRSPWACSGCMWVGIRCVCISVSHWSHWFHVCVSDHHEHAVGVCGWGPDVCVSQCLIGSISVFQITMSVQWVYVGGDQMCVYLSVSLVPSLCFRSPWACSGCMWVGTRCVCISVSHWFHLCVSDHHEHAVGVCGWGPDMCVSHWFHVCVSDHHDCAVGVCGWGPDVCVSQCLTGSISVFQITMSVQWVYVGGDQMCVYLSVSLVPSLCFRSPWACSGCMWVGIRCVCISVSHWFHVCVSNHHEHAVGVCGWRPDICVS